MKNLFFDGLRAVDLAGLWLAMLSLRVLLGWDFFESGLEKYQGENWFFDIQDKFPFPFGLLPPEISWQMATWFELIGGVALVLGLQHAFSLSC
jgi:putative oxidoreductase